MTSNRVGSRTDRSYRPPSFSSISSDSPPETHYTGARIEGSLSAKDGVSHRFGWGCRSFLQAARGVERTQYFSVHSATVHTLYTQPPNWFLLAQSVCCGKSASHGETQALWRLYISVQLNLSNQFLGQILSARTDLTLWGRGHIQLVFHTHPANISQDCGGTFKSIKY